MREKDGIVLSIWKLIYPVLIFLGVEIAIQVVMTGAYMVVHIPKMDSFNTEAMDELTQGAIDFYYKYALYAIILRSAIVIPLFCLFIKRDNKRDILLHGEMARPVISRVDYLLLAILGITAAFGFNGVVALLNIAKFSKSYSQVEDVLFSGGLIIQILASAVAAPLVEEMLFRGLIQKRLHRFVDPKYAVIIAALVFGLIHMNLVQFIYAFLMGMIFGSIYEKLKTIWAPIIMHAAANFVSVIFTWFGFGIPGLVYLLSIVAELILTYYIYKYIVAKAGRVNEQNS